jgi:hypothetical protein
MPDKKNAQTSGKKSGPISATLPAVSRSPSSVIDAPDGENGLDTLCQRVVYQEEVYRRQERGRSTFFEGNVKSKQGKEVMNLSQ